VQRSVLITGATDGIGLALARLLSERGDRLLLVGRRETREVRGSLPAGALYLAADLAREDAAARVVAALEAAGTGPLDLLVLNAAVGRWGHPTEDTAERIREMVGVNLRAPVALARALLPRLIEAHGSVVLVGSVADALPCPDFAAYAATKAALSGFARSLRVELRDRVRVQVIRPGAVRTGMHRKAGVPAPIADGMRWPSADAAARAILRRIDRGTREATLGWGNRAARFAGRHFAGTLDGALRRRRR
jgi:short-subunit dehydrogenase